MKLKKKAQTAGMLVTILATVIAFTLIALTIRSFVTDSGDSEAEVLCHDSVLLREAATINFEGTEIRSAPLLCKTIDKTVSGDKDGVRQEFIDAMTRCWWMFNEGKIKSNIFKKFEISGNNNCFTCYTIVVQESDEFKAGDSISPEEFIEFIEDEEYPKSGTKYLDYFQSYGGDGKVITLFSGESKDNYYGITPQRAYAVAFGSRTDDCSWCTSAILGGGVGVLAGGGLIAAVVLAPISGGGSLALYGIAAGGALAAGGTGVAIAGASGKYSDAFLEERDLSTIYLVDISDPALANSFQGACESVTDIAGE